MTDIKAGTAEIKREMRLLRVAYRKGTKTLLAFGFAATAVLIAVFAKGFGWL